MWMVPSPAHVPGRRLANGDRGSQFIARDSASDRKPGTFWVSSDSDLYRWRHGDESDLTEYIYCPHVQFGDIGFTSWGTMYEGSWSFSYVEVRAFATPPPVSFDPPERGEVGD